MIIDHAGFRYVEYKLSAVSEKHLMYFTKFNKDYMLDISILYSDSLQGEKMLDRLRSSAFKWQ